MARKEKWRGSGGRQQETGGEYGYTHAHACQSRSCKGGTRHASGSVMTRYASTWHGFATRDGHNNQPYPTLTILTPPHLSPPHSTLPSHRVTSNANPDGSFSTTPLIRIPLPLRHTLSLPNRCYSPHRPTHSASRSPRLERATLTSHRPTATSPDPHYLNSAYPSLIYPSHPTPTHPIPSNPHPMCTCRNGSHPIPSNPRPMCTCRNGSEQPMFGMSASSVLTCTSQMPSATPRNSACRAAMVCPSRSTHRAKKTCTYTFGSSQ